FLLLENVPEFPAPLTSPVSRSIILWVTSRIFSLFFLSGIRKGVRGTVTVIWSPDLFIICGNIKSDVI
ncbi:unnamed protein product, partial [Staurois parvus]